MQSLPLILVGGIAVVMIATRVVQLVQTHVLHVLPFGSLGQFSLLDVCTGILVSGLFMIYFGACCVTMLSFTVRSLSARCCVSPGAARLTAVCHSACFCYYSHGSRKPHTQSSDHKPTTGSMPSTLHLFHSHGD